jgi:hypothetical protein
MVDVGDLVPMTSFTYVTPSLKVGFKSPKGRTTMFLLLGHSDKNDPFDFDFETALNSLGFFRKKSKKT